jgi:hypothetical protein
MWYRIFWIEEQSYSLECYQYGAGHRAAKEANLGRYRLVPASVENNPLLPTPNVQPAELIHGPEARSIRTLNYKD